VKVTFRIQIGTCLATAVLVAASLVVAEPSCANTSEVEVLNCAASSQEAHITIDLHGKPTTDVNLTVTTLQSELVQVLSIDDSGLAVLPPLTPAKYLVTASAPENLGGSICVEISKKKSKQVSSFSLALKPLSPSSLSIEQMLAAAENSARSEHLQEFKGLVVEPSGMGVSGTVIQIFPRGARARDDARAVKAITDAKGHFSAALADGIYTALFMTPGFETKIVTFEISAQGTANGLRISLQLGIST
jgi:hypothetical protein